MKKTKKIQQEIEVIDDIFCNKCGGSLKISIEGDGWSVFNYCGVEEYTVIGVYGSTELDDGASFTFSLCDFCTNQLFNSFKIPVEIS